MKTKQLFCLFFALFLIFLCGCVEEYPEPVFDPTSVEKEMREKVGIEENSGVFFTLYNDMTCHVSEMEAENLTSLAIEIPAYYADYKVVAIEEEVFRGANITSVTLPEGLLTIGDRAFQKSTIEKINLPASLESIGEECFDNCLSLKEITIGENLKNIPLGAFSGCRSLESLTLSEGVETIGEEAFSSLSSLKKLTLPQSLREIGPYAFFSTGTSQLEIVIPETVEKIGKDALKGTAFLKKQKDEFVLVGKGVLILYQGSAKELTLPENTLYLSNAFDKSAVETLTLNAGLTGICENALEEAQVKKVLYSGDNKEIKNAVKDYQ